MARRKKIPYETIAACKMGNEEALQTILKHYEPMIIEAATHVVSLPDGTVQRYVDEDIKAYIESELAMTILMKHDLTRKPAKKTTIPYNVDNVENTAE